MKKKATSAPKKTGSTRRKAAAAPIGKGLVEESPGAYAVAPPPARAKTFRVGGSQAVRLPKAFRLPDGEVIIEKRGDEIVLKAALTKKRMTDREIVEWMRKLHAEYGKPTEEWPDIVRPGPETNRPMKDLEW